MTNEQEWQLVFYIDENGNDPVHEFIADLDEKTQTRILLALERLRVQNIQAREPLVKHIEGKLWEVRQSSANNIYRVFYFFFTGRRIILLHGFQKKTQKTPRQEIETAQRRMNDYLDQQED